MSDNQSESEYSDEQIDQKNIKKRDGRRGRTIKRLQGGKHTPKMKQKILKLWAARDAAVRKRAMAKERMKLLEARLREYELKEIREGVFKKVKIEDDIQDSEDIREDLPIERPVLRREAAVALERRRKENPTPEPEPDVEKQRLNPFAGYF
jgi:hypothetical protein